MLLASEKLPGWQSSQCCAAAPLLLLPPPPPSSSRKRPRLQAAQLVCANSGWLRALGQTSHGVLALRSSSYSPGAPVCREEARGRARVREARGTRTHRGRGGPPPEDLGEDTGRTHACHMSVECPNAQAARYSVWAATPPPPPRPLPCLALLSTPGARRPCTPLPPAARGALLDTAHTRCRGRSRSRRCRRRRHRIAWRPRRRSCLGHATGTVRGLHVPGLSTLTLVQMGREHTRGNPANMTV